MTKKWLLPLAVSALLLLLTVTALAVSGYDLSWWTVDSGGGESSASGYTLQGSIGQPDTGFSQGGPYQLSGGFFVGSVAPRLKVYLPLIMKY